MKVAVVSKAEADIEPDELNVCSGIETLFEDLVVQVTEQVSPGKGECNERLLVLEQVSPHSELLVTTRVCVDDYRWRLC